MRIKYSNLSETAIDIGIVGMQRNILDTDSINVDSKNYPTLFNITAGIVIALSAVTTAAANEKLDPFRIKTTGETDLNKEFCIPKRKNDNLFDIISCDDSDTDALRLKKKLKQIAKLNLTVLNDIKIDKARRFLLEHLYPVDSHAKANLEMYFDKTALYLRSLNIESIDVSHTTSDSIFYAIRDKSLNEFRLEVFYNFNSEDEEDVEATLHIYKSNVKKSAHYGSIKYLFTVIKETCSKSKISFESSPI